VSVYGEDLMAADIGHEKAVVVTLRIGAAALG
jgi:hypothetical protein